MKKLFFTLCALCLCGTMWAAVDQTYGLSYTVSDEVATITEPEDGITYSNTNLVTYTGDEVAEGVTAVTIPEYVDGYQVVAVGASAFEGASISGHLVVPSYITTVGEMAFKSCTGLTEVTYEYSETALKDESAGNNTGSESFNGCSGVTTVHLNRDITIGHSGYLCAPFCYNTSVTTVYIGEYVNLVPDYMFRNTSTTCLATVYCYASTPPTLGTAPFANLASEHNLYVNYDDVNTYKANSSWEDAFGKANIHSLTGVDPDEPVDENAFQYNGLWYDPIFDENSEETGDAQIIKSQDETVYSGTITIPATTTNVTTGKTYNVTRVDASAFDGSSISGHLVIPANITNLGTAAFRNCTELTEVTFEYSKTPIYDECPDSNQGDECFIGCSKLATVNLYRDVTLAGGDGVIDGSFAYHTAIATINIGPRVTEIPHHMFNTNSNSYSLTTINCYTINPPELGNAAFRAQYLNSAYVVNVPFGTEEAYLSDTGTYGWATMFAYGTSTLAGHIAEMSDAFAITTHDNGEGSAYATFYNGEDNVVLFDGELTAYQATQLGTEDGELIIDISSLGSVIPKATGVVVETPTAGTYLAIVTESQATEASDNLLYGSDTTTDITEPGDGYLYYLLSSVDGVVGFYWGADNGGAFQCQAHRAYLALPQGDEGDDNNPSQISIRKGNGGEDTTGISSVESATEGATVKGIYTIQGVRVNNMNQPGLYIVDGRKVLKR